MSEVGADDREVEAEVILSDDGRAVLRRLFVEVAADADPDQTVPVRRTACWLSDGGDRQDGRPASVGVHVGQYEIGVLAEQDSLLAGEVLRRVGGTEKRAGTFAEIRGNAADSAAMTVYFASPLK